MKLSMLSPLGSPSIAHEPAPSILIRRLYWRAAWLLAIHGLHLCLLADKAEPRFEREKEMDS